MGQRLDQPLMVTQPHDAAPTRLQDFGQPRHMHRSCRRPIIIAFEMCSNHHTSIHHQCPSCTNTAFDKDFGAHTAAASKARVSKSGRPTTPDQLPDNQRT